MGDSFSPGSRDVCLVTAVVVWAVPNIPSIDAMLSPSFALMGSFINQCSDSRRCHGRSVVSEGAIHVREGRHVVLQAGGA